MSEPAEIRLKRLSMRSHRRGTREMDEILGAFADERLAELDAERLDLYERLLAENDQDLYRWISRQAPAPETLAPLLDEIAARFAARGAQ